MSVVIWGSETSSLKKHLEHSLEQAGCGSELIVETTMDALRSRLLNHRPEIEALILSPRTAQELTALIELRPLLAGLRVLVLLPENTCDTVTLAHLLMPRYAAPASGDPNDLAAVLLNMLRHEASARQDRA